MTLSKPNVLTLFLFCVASIMAMYTVLTTRVISLDATDWGVLNRLPVAYWLGIVTVGVLILFSLRNSKSLNLKISLTIFVLILIYTNFIPQIIQVPINLSTMSLWPSSQAYLTISTGHIAVGQPYQLLDYNNWPFFSIFTSIFMLVTGSPLAWLLKWFPLFTITLWALLVFIILKKFLEPKYGLIGAALFLCGSWTKQQYFGPQSIAYVLFLMIIYLFLNSKGTFNFNKRSSVILALVTFTGLVFFHVLTPAALLLMFVATYIITNLFAGHYVKRSKSLFCFILLCATTLVVYSIYVIPNFVIYAFDRITSTFGEIVGQQLNRVAGSQYQTFTNASIYGVLFGFIGTSLICLFLMFRNKNQPKLQPLTYFSIFGALALLALVPYGEEGPFRAYIFILPFLVLISVSYLKRKPLLIGTLMSIFLILSIPAIYGSGVYCLATSPELAGAEYVEHYLPSTSVVLGKLEPFVRYFNPLSRLKVYHIGVPPFTSSNSLDIEQNLHKTNYLTISRNQINYAEYYSGTNPYQNLNLPQNINATRCCLYDNGNFSVYMTDPFIAIQPTGG